MDTLLIQVNSQKARSLLQALEDSHLIKVLKEHATPGRTAKNEQVSSIQKEWWNDKEFVAELDQISRAMETGEDKGVSVQELKDSIEQLRIARYGA